MNTVSPNENAFIDIRAHGAVGDGQTDNTGAIQQALDAAGNSGPSTVLIPPGDWLSGSLQLRGNTTLFLAKNAVLRASDDVTLYPHYKHGTWSRMDIFPWRAFLFGADLENITIAGEGTMECGGRHAVFQDHIGNSPDRPYGIHLVNCRNVRIEGIRLRNSAHWMLRCLECSDITLRGLDIFNHCNANNDGMDIDSCNDVLITECRVDASDDGICLKSEGASPCKNVLVSDCRVSSHASALKLGTASVGGFQNISFNQCLIRPSRSSEMHHPFSFWQGMTGIDIGCVDGGITEAVRFTNITMDGVANPIFIKLGNRHSTRDIPKNRRSEDGLPGREVKGPGTLENVLLSGITARNAGHIPSIITGYEGHPVRQVTLRDIDIHCVPTERDIDPDAAPDWSSAKYPCAWAIAGEGLLPAYGLYGRYLDGLTLDNVRIEAAKGEKREKMIIEHAERVLEK